MREVLRRKDFRLLFAGMCATMTGESALLLVLAIWVKDLTGSSSYAGVTLLAIAAPAMAAPLLGWVVDRFRRRPFLVVAGLSTVALLAPLALVRDAGDIWIIYAVGVGYGTSMLVVSAALNGLIKEMLPDDLLASANGALQTVRQGLRLVGPIGGAAVYTTIGPRGVLAIDAACLLLGAAAIAALKVRQERPVPGELRWLGEVSLGLKHLWATAALRRGTIGLALSTTVIGFAETIIFSYVDLGLHRGSTFVTIIVCLQGVGGLTGGLSAAAVIRRIGELAATGVGVLLLAVGMAGFGIPLAIVGFNTLMQRETPAPVLGRVSAAAEALISTPQTLSIGAGAALAAILDYRLLFALASFVMLIASAYLWVGRSLSRPGGKPVLAVPLQRCEVLLDVDDRRVGQG
jgi:MFS family permease